MFRWDYDKERHVALHPVDESCSYYYCYEKSREAYDSLWQAATEGDEKAFLHAFESMLAEADDAMDDILEHHCGIDYHARKRLLREIFAGWPKGRRDKERGVFEFSEEIT